MRRFTLIGSGLVASLGFVACGDDTGTSGSTSTSTSTSTSSSSSTGGGTTTSAGGAGQGGGAQGGGGSSADGGGGGGGGGVQAAWVHDASDANEEAVYDIEAAADGGVLVLGYFTGSSDWGSGNLTSAGGADIVLTKYAADGTHVFTKQFGGTGNDFAKKLVVGPSGEILITGSVGANVTFGTTSHVVGGFSDAFLLKLDSSGNPVWSKVFGSVSNSDVGMGLSVNASGTVAMTGQFGGTVDFGNGNRTALNAVDGFVSAYDSGGTHVFTTTFFAGTAPTAHGVALDVDGSTYLSGAFTGTLSASLGSKVSAGQEDIFLVKLDAGGNQVWSKSFGGAGQEFGMYLELDSAGNLVQTGNLSGSANFGGTLLTSAGAADIFVARFEPDGDHLSSVRFGDADDQFVSDLETGPNGTVLVGGWFNGTFSVGSVSLASTSSLQDGFWFEVDASNVGVDGTAYVNQSGSTQLLGLDFAPAGVYIGGNYGLAVTIEGVDVMSAAGDYYSAYWGYTPL